MTRLVPAIRMGLVLVSACLALDGCRLGGDDEAPFQTRLFKRGSPPQVLEWGDVITRGDELYVALEIHRAVHVYAINEDARGNQLIIHPCSGLRAGLFAPGTDHRLPSPFLGRETFWPVRDLTKRERIIVLASPTPIEPLEDAVSADGGGELCAVVPPAAAAHFLDRLRESMIPRFPGEREGMVAGRFVNVDGEPAGIWVAMHEVRGEPTQ